MLGQWHIWPKAGEKDSDPYTKAYLAREGIAWMSIVEGLMLFAMADDQNNHFSSHCQYSLTGKIPRGRLWTLTSRPRSGSTEIIAAQSNVITSNDVIWNEDGGLVISISKNAEPGNWLPLSASDDFILTLRIYDTPLTSSALDAAIKTPVIERQACS